MGTEERELQVKAYYSRLSVLDCQLADCLEMDNLLMKNSIKDKVSFKPSTASASMKKKQGKSKQPAPDESLKEAIRQVVQEKVDMRKKKQKYHCLVPEKLILHQLFFPEVESVPSTQSKVHKDFENLSMMGHYESVEKSALKAVANLEENTRGDRFSELVCEGSLSNLDKVFEVETSQVEKMEKENSVGKCYIPVDNCPGMLKKAGGYKKGEVPEALRKMRKMLLDAQDENLKKVLLRI